MIDEDQHEIRSAVQGARPQADADSARRLRLRAARRVRQAADRQPRCVARLGAAGGLPRRRRPAVPARRTAMGLPDRRRPRPPLRRAVARRGRRRRRAASDHQRPARILPGRPRGVVAPRARRSVRPAGQPRRTDAAGRCTGSKAATIAWPSRWPPPLGDRRAAEHRAGRRFASRQGGARHASSTAAPSSPDLLRLSGPRAAGDDAAARPDHAGPAGASSTTRSPG